jgi:nucleotide-binding universal stress UspA family protein
MMNAVSSFRRLLMPAAALFLTLAVGGVSADEPKALRVAVLTFTSAEGKAFTSCDVTVTPLRNAGQELSREIGRRLALDKGVEVVEDSVLKRHVAEHRLAKRGVLDEEAILRLAELVDADIVVIGQTDGTRWGGHGHAGASLFAALQLLSRVDRKVTWSNDDFVQNTGSADEVVPMLAEKMMPALLAQVSRSVDSGLLALADAGKAGVTF